MTHPPTTVSGLARRGLDQRQETITFVLSSTLSAMLPVQKSNRLTSRTTPQQRQFAQVTAYAARRTFKAIHTRVVSALQLSSTPRGLRAVMSVSIWLTRKESPQSNGATAGSASKGFGAAHQWSQRARTASLRGFRRQPTRAVAFNSTDPVLVDCPASAGSELRVRSNAELCDRRRPQEAGPTKS